MDSLDCITPPHINKRLLDKQVNLLQRQQETHNSLHNTYFIIIIACLRVLSHLPHEISTLGRHRLSSSFVFLLKDEFNKLVEVKTQNKSALALNIRMESKNPINLILVGEWVCSFRTWTTTIYTSRLTLPAATSTQIQIPCHPDAEKRFWREESLDGSSVFVWWSLIITSHHHTAKSQRWETNKQRPGHQRPMTFPYYSFPPPSSELRPSVHLILIHAGSVWCLVSTPSSSSCVLYIPIIHYNFILVRSSAAVSSSP